MYVFDGLMVKSYLMVLVVVDSLFFWFVKNYHFFPMNFKAQQVHTHINIYSHNYGNDNHNNNNNKTIIFGSKKTQIPFLLHMYVPPYIDTYTHSHTGSFLSHYFQIVKKFIINTHTQTQVQIYREEKKWFIRCIIHIIYLAATIGP